ncbi:hypothetical protein [Romboutsia lituseburensis]|uniref:hypothetical protein n=1 Tax=Romboutsia lituseburensis TaxID=1537 RepID=UPI00215B4671|nr:hypothetical protein [Romboutsia lituseburensis]MCR8746672.1 hypothetical protein [Romboutsia lituseburensis]
MKKILTKVITIAIAVVCMSGCFILKASALPYYDLKFEEHSRNIVTGEFEKIGENLSLKKESKLTMNIKKSYNPRTSIELNKDELDAISQVLGSKWQDALMIDKKEDIKINKKKDTYLHIRPVYKEVKGTLVQDYQSWSQKKEVTILIPIDVEYKITTN